MRSGFCDSRKEIDKFGKQRRRNGNINNKLASAEKKNFAIVSTTTGEKRKRGEEAALEATLKDSR